MNGGQDLGGRHGFGPVAPEEDEPWFHADWERRAFALTLAMGFTGQWNIDASRHARESLHPVRYLSSSYYEIWEAGLERLMVERGLVSEEEIEAGRALTDPVAVKRILKGENVASVLAAGGPVERDTNTEPAFAVDDAVRTIIANPTRHTRLPAYARGRPGTIARVHGCHVFPDANAQGLGEEPHWLYSVRFDARDLWGADGRAGDAVHIDLWEPYLERA
jgi:nitrile hydratase beta subunit